MIRSLIALPFRLGIKATELALRPVVAGTKLALELLGHAGEQAAPPSRPPQPGVVPTPPPEPAPTPPRPAPPPPAPIVIEAEPEPVGPPPEPHVSEEPELVAESADAEAVEGAFAEIEIAEPWDGYRRLKADEIVAAVAALNREELAMVELYEGSHRGRKSVITAVERRLKQLSGPAQRRG